MFRTHSSEPFTLLPFLQEGCAQKMETWGLTRRGDTFFGVWAVLPPRLNASNPSDNLLGRRLLRCGHQVADGSSLRRSEAPTCWTWHVHAETRSCMVMVCPVAESLAHWLRGAKRSECSGATALCQLVREQVWKAVKPDDPRFRLGTR